MRKNRDRVGRPLLESLLFIVGDPLSHTLSPAMHNGVIARRKLPIRYIAIRLAPGCLPEFLRVARGGSFLGGNVTIPFKEEAARLADDRSGAVRFCGAANVLRIRGGRVRAENTDGPGFLDALADQGWGRRFPTVVLLGAGGSARGIAYALGRAGTRRLTVLNRTPERAERLAETLAPAFPRMEIATGEMDPKTMRGAFAGADLVVQSTSLGLTAEWKDFPADAIKEGTRFADIVYRSGGTALVRTLRSRGVPAIDGLPMLACQAARSFGAWTGRKVAPEEFLFFARRALAPSRARLALDRTAKDF